MPRHPELVLLTRPGCTLCEEFETELRAALGRREFTLQHVDVDSKAEWRIRYGRSIPVLLDNAGALVCETHFDADALERHL